jgi:hypothetical protein
LSEKQDAPQGWVSGSGIDQHAAANADSRMAQVVVAWAYSFPSGPTILASDVPT